MKINDLHLNKEKFKETLEKLKDEINKVSETGLKQWATKKEAGEVSN